MNAAMTAGRETNVIREAEANKVEVNKAEVNRVEVNKVEVNSGAEQGHRGEEITGHQVLARIRAGRREETGPR